jgi:nitroimidazol reductase NimA-like FMN-containing flavoprotein (pyridoxamine 5'-phosphate oxidase superfamily)
MNQPDPARARLIQELIDQTSDLTLATVRPDGYPQATTVSYANDGMTLYVSVGLDSQKARNIQHSDKVSLTINRPYADWHQIQGLSMAATARIVSGADELEHARDCMLRKFPDLGKMIGDEHSIPWNSSVFLRIAPQVVSLLDYTLGFGHTELYRVSPPT